MKENFVFVAKGKTPILISKETRSTVDEYLVILDTIMTEYSVWAI